MPCPSAMLFTMKLGPLPMYVLAPIKTDPQDTAASSACPRPERNIAPRFCTLVPSSPDAMAVKVKYVGALSRTLDNPPDNQKKCHGAFKSNAVARALRISSAGTMVMNIPRNRAATSTIGPKWKWFSRWIERGVVYHDILAIVIMTAS